MYSLDALKGDAMFLRCFCMALMRELPADRRARFARI